MKQFAYWIMISLFTITLYGCSKKDFVESIIINNTSLDIEFLKGIPSDGGSRELQFKSPSDWFITVNDTRTSSWISVSPSSGSAGNVRVAITTSENNTLDERQSKITISAGSITKYIDVLQKQKDALTLTSSRFEATKEGGEIEVEVKANVEFNISIAECCSDWISQVKTKALTAHNLIFKISPSEESETRIGTITISDGKLSEKIQVFQAAEKVLILNKKEYNIPSLGDTIAVELSSNFDFEVVMPDNDWVKEATTRAISSHSRYFNISANTTYNARSAEIIFKSKDGTISNTVSINQAQKDAIIISTKEFYIGIEGGEIDVKIESNIESEISFDCEWISQITTRALETYNLKFKVEPYDGEIRNCKITIKDKNRSISEDFTITQVKDGVPILYKSTNYSKDGEVLTLQTAAVGNGINLVIVGDAFSDKDMATGGKYEQRMSEAMNHFFSEEPYKTYRNRYNVYCVKAVSKNEIYIDGSETVFSCKFLGGTAIIGDDEKVFTYALKVPSITDTRHLTVITILNSPKYAGTCYMYYNNNASISYCPIVDNDDERYRQIVTHEAGGHGFAKLFDEYFDTGSVSTAVISYYQYLKEFGWAANVDVTDDPTMIRWAHILSDSRYNGMVGIHKGALSFTEGAYRATDYSIMRYNTGGFNPPSREAIFNLIMELSGESYNYEKFVDYDVRNHTENAKETSKTQAAKVDTKTFIPLAPPVIIRSTPNVLK